MNTASALPLPFESNNVRHIGVDQRIELPGPPNAPFVREQVHDDGHLWIGMVTTEPGACSPWHHHGEYDTYVYALDGQGALEFGNGDTIERVDFAADGSWVHIPGGLRHREINTGSVKNSAIVVRVGQGASVVPCEAPASI